MCQACNVRSEASKLIAETIKAKELHIKAKELYEAKHNELLKEFHKH